MGGGQRVITAVAIVEKNIPDSKTIAPLLKQCEQRHGYRPDQVIYHRGGRGVAKIGQTMITTPGKPLKEATAYDQPKGQKKFRMPTAIEPIIGHLKAHFRMGIN